MIRYKNKRKLVILCLQLLLFTVVYAKDPTEVKSNDGIIPRVGASPEVAMLGKFAYAPVNNYNGVPDISIPLYTIQENGIELPIVLRYNSSGIKVSEEATWVGLGWDLTVGGAITQIPVGQPDQNDNLSLGGNPNGYGYANRMIAATKKVSGTYNVRNEDGNLFSCMNVPASLDSYSGFWLVNKYKYGAPDNYLFSIPGISGKFFIDQVNNTINFLGNRTEQVIIKGLNLTSTSVPYSNNWTITDLNGVQYNFNSADKEITDTYPQPVINNSGTDNAFTSATWRISSIVYPACTINFTYTNAKVTTNSYSEYYFRPEYMIALSVPDGKKLDQKDECFVKYLNKVESNNQRIEFELSTLSTDRQDLSGAKRINRITIFDKLNNRKIKSYKFNYDYFNSINTNSLDFKRLKLMSIDEIGYNGTVEEKIGTYKFEYDETKPLPSKRSFAMDYWGYYNGRSANTGLLPKLNAEVVLNTIPEASTLPPEVINDFLTKGNANRGVDTLYMKAGILTKITYPTGGALKLQYQANSFTNYCVLSAHDIDLSGTSSQNISLSDIHYYNTSAPMSDKLYPDKNGKLTLYNFVFNVTRLANTTSKLTGANFKNAQVVLRKWTYYPIEIVKKWEISASDLQNFTNQIIQTGSGNYSYKLDKFEYQGDPTNTYTLEVTLGDQMPTTMCSYPCEAIASLSCTVSKISTLNECYGGGLRVASQEVYDTNNQLILKKLYAYTNENGTSSGKLMSPLKLFSFQKKVYKKVTGLNIQSSNNAYLFTISSYSSIPLAYDASGSLVGYSRVVVAEVEAANKTNGQTVFYYYNTPTQFTGGLPDVSNIPNYDNGLESKVQYYDAQKKLLKESIFNYASVQNNESTGVFIYDNYIGPDKCDFPGVLGNPYAYHGRWYVCTYPLIGRFYKPTKKTDTDYFQGKPVVNEYVYEYNQYGQPTLESHRQLANGGKEDKQYKYPLGETDATSSSLRLKGLYNSILNEKTTRNNAVADEKNYEYTTTTTGNMKVSAIREMINNDPYYQLSSVLYDAKDNVRQYLKNTDPMTVILWGYNYQYPVAEIKGLSYADVLTALGQALIDRVALGTPSVADMNTIRTVLASKTALVTTYTYYPLIGIISSTASNGLTTYYSYVFWGRLKETYFMDGATKKVIQSYTYHYQNQ